MPNWKALRVVAQKVKDYMVNLTKDVSKKTPDILMSDGVKRAVWDYGIPYVQGLRKHTLPAGAGHTHLIAALQEDNPAKSKIFLNNAVDTYYATITKSPSVKEFYAAFWIASCKIKLGETPQASEWNIYAYQVGAKLLNDNQYRTRNGVKQLLMTREELVGIAETVDELEGSIPRNKVIQSEPVKL